ncbi:hypothetical protein [Nonomuraea sp. NPDC049028]|uniref:hypothetical protein n=1 Tax=Nonomuraea sp. NPDC049028 TaxID=3364348 RepID=UPI00371611A7
MHGLKLLDGPPHPDRRPARLVGARAALLVDRRAAEREDRLGRGGRRGRDERLRAGPLPTVRPGFGGRSLAAGRLCLSPTTREHLGLDADRPPADDPHACLADNWRFYRAFDRLTSLLDPARHDHRTRLPQHEADLLATAWQDHDPDHTRKRNLLQDIVTALVLTPARWGKGRGYLAGFRGNVGIDTTAAPVFARPPRTRRSTGELFASTEITAG